MEKKLVEMTVKELVKEAGMYNIKGRHDMKKAELIEAISAAEAAEQDFHKTIEAERAADELIKVSEEEADIAGCKAGKVKIEFADEMDKDVIDVFAKDLDDEWDDIDSFQNDPGSVLKAASSIVKHEETDALKQKQYYIENAKIGAFVAFRVNNVKTLSGKIDEIHKTDFVIETKNGTKFTISKSDVIWVKSGSRWPRGVFLELKGVYENGENTGANKGNV